MRGIGLVTLPGHRFSGPGSIRLPGAVVNRAGELLQPCPVPDELPGKFDTLRHARPGGARNDPLPARGQGTGCRVLRVQRTGREFPMRKRRGRVVFKVLAHVGAIAPLYLVFSFALFLGLQVRPLYGNIGLGFAAVLAAAYVYVGFIRRK